jgi:hypothetical protein
LEDGLPVIGSARVVAHESTVTRGEGNRLWVLAAVGLGLLGMLLWSPAPPPSGTSPQDVTGPTAGPVAGGGRATTTTTATTTPLAAVTGLDTTTTIVGSGGPVLGQPVGLALLVSSGASLERVDLDTGEVTGYEVRGWPVHASGGWLLLNDPTQAESLRALPLDDLQAAEGSPVGSTVGWPDRVHPGPEPGQVWVMGYTESFVWRLIRLDDGDVLDQLPALFGLNGPIFTGPSVMTSVAGGVFVHAGGQWRKVSEGMPLAVSDQYVLAQTCSQPLACGLEWIDRATWQQVVRPVPEAAGIVGGVWLSPDGRVLAFSADAGPPQVFDVERGEVVDLVPVDPAGVRVSPDGRYLVTAVEPEGQLAVYDLDSGERHEVALHPTSHDSRALLVEIG